MECTLRITSTAPNFQPSDFWLPVLYSTHTDDYGKAVRVESEECGILEFNRQGTEVRNNPFRVHPESISDLESYIDKYAPGPQVRS